MTAFSIRRSCSEKICEALMLNILGTVVIGLAVDRGERRPRPERQIDPAIPENLHDD